MAEPRQSDFPLWLSQALKESGHDPKWLADQMGVMPYVVNTYLDGSVVPRGKTVARIQDILNRRDYPCQRTYRKVQAMTHTDVMCDLEQERVLQPVRIAVTSAWHTRIMLVFKAALQAQGLQPEFVHLPAPSTALLYNELFNRLTCAFDFVISDEMILTYDRLRQVPFGITAVFPLYKYAGYSLLINREFLERRYYARGLSPSQRPREFLSSNQYETTNLLPDLLADGRIGVQKGSSSEVYLRYLSKTLGVGIAKGNPDTDRFYESEANLRAALESGEIDVMVNTSPPDLVSNDTVFFGNDKFALTQCLFSSKPNSHGVARSVIVAWSRGIWALKGMCERAIKDGVASPNILKVRSLTTTPTPRIPVGMSDAKATRRFASWMDYSGMLGPVSWVHYPQDRQRYYTVLQEVVIGLMDNAAQSR